MAQVTSILHNSHMPNFKTHLATGILAGAAVALLQENWRCARNESHRIDLLKIAMGGVIGGATSCVADILEPAVNPNHRRFFHSLGFACLVLYLWNQNQNRLDEPTRELGEVAGCGYLSHLALDFCTPRCLPLI